MGGGPLPMPCPLTPPTPGAGVRARGVVVAGLAQPSSVLRVVGVQVPLDELPAREGVVVGHCGVGGAVGAASVGSAGGVGAGAVGVPP